MADFRHIEEQLRGLKEAGRYRPMTVWKDGSDAWMTVEGGKRALQMSSNNYLGLTHHPKLKAAAIAATEKYGVGSGSVRTITGTLSIHDELEWKLAAFKGTEAALVFQSGFTTNQGVLGTILGPDDVVISDELNHASIIDGIRLTKASRRIFAHKDMDQLEAVLKECGNYRQRVVVTDGVFSMDGDIAPLPAIVELAEKYDALVYVDDAHASGVLGKHGKGSTDHFGLHGRVHFQIGTLSKAVGAVGGYVATARAAKELMINSARSFLFSTSLPPSVAASCIAALEVLQEEPELTERLWKNADGFRSRLQSLGFDTGESETPIIPIIVGQPERALAFSKRLLEEGVCAQGIVYPTVAMDKGRVRLIVTAQHSEADLGFAADVLENVGKEFGLV
ncbi:glycine C-acetyltransferase [Paenibacillus sp. J5C_2022]|uniref:glycine C-acetyltransferase n=1 Tax=Paenibacillus sp. J5C2022 TaxID=2977129 RepID=UPI0021D03696|nr:glycine C-acetyltransferase [Paenibacillus sp. J5C2022]MCU6712791.1 glycine C-acetyltransferase [Paenibacillus sp. J5C2022]